jgi:IQ motif/SEC7 domain-containing protein
MLTGYYPQHQQQHQMSLDGQNGSGGKDVSSKNRPLTSSVYKTPTTTSVLISASSSRMFTSNSYEISDEISRANVQVLERKYGGRIRAHTAATKIQRAFRRFRLEQQFQNALKYPGPPGRRKHHHIQPMLALPNDSSLNSFHLNGDRQLYTRKLALSQPTLRYQPVCSLRAQLRAEQKASIEDSYNNYLASPTSAGSQNHSPVHNRTPPSPRPTEPMPTRYIGNPPKTWHPINMSPRLTQRRPQEPAAYVYTTGHRTLHSAVDLPLPPASTTVVYSGAAVAAGTAPTVWVRHQHKGADKQYQQQPQYTDENRKTPWKEANNRREKRNFLGDPRKEASRPRSSENGHTSACYTNSLPRLDRRNHSLGPHTTSNNSAGFQPSFTPPPNLRIMPPHEEQYRKRCYRIALNYFNKKPDRGLYLLIHFGFVENSAQAVAEFFLHRRGLSRLMIGEFLGTLHSPFHAEVLDAYLDGITMYEMEIDVALRHMLTYFRFPGEAQKIDHIIQAFAKRYLWCNPTKYPKEVDVDCIYVIAFAIIMLNTDLHTPSIKNSKRMKLEDFIINLRGVDGTEHFTDKMLTGIYERVKQYEFKTSTDHVTQVSKVDETLVGKGKPHLVEQHRRLICYCRLNQVQDINRKQSATDHNRELFLFNDLLIVAKTMKKKATQYNLRYWTPLLGLKISSFKSPFYHCGLQLNCPDGAEFLFNAKNDDDKYVFQVYLSAFVNAFILEHDFTMMLKKLFSKQQKWKVFVLNLNSISNLIKFLNVILLEIALLVIMLVVKLFLMDGIKLKNLMIFLIQKLIIIPQLQTLVLQFFHLILLPQLHQFR